MANPATWIVKGKGKQEVKSQGVTLHFLAKDGKAVAIYTAPDKTTEVEIKNRNHAVKLAKKAVANANAANLPFHILHGTEDPDSNPIRPTYTATCLSAEAYVVVMEVEKEAEHNGLFKPSW